MKKILLVEDNADEELLTIRAIKKSGIASKVIVARNGQEAIDLLFKKDNQPPLVPDLILLDLQLPVLSGLEVLQKIRSNPQTSSLLITILTSSNEQKDLLKAYGLRVNSYIKKPVDYKQFNEVISKISSYWLELNEAPVLKY